MSLVTMFHRYTQPRQTIRFDTPVIDEQTDRELRSRYLLGQISIGTYLDRRFGTSFSVTGSTGDTPPAR